jgi:transposase-like protein
VGSKAFGGLHRRLKEKTAESRWFETTGQAPFGRAKAAYWKIKEAIVIGTRVYTDEYSMYACLRTWGYDHKSVNHGRGEFARDDDGDGVCEVYVHTMEGFWSLLRSWPRPHRGISQEKLPVYLGFFEFVHNVRKRGKALLPALIELLVT